MNVCYIWLLASHLNVIWLFVMFSWVDCISSEMWYACALCLVGLIASHLKCDVIMCYIWFARCDCVLCLVGLIASHLKGEVINWWKMQMQWLSNVICISSEMQMHTRNPNGCSKRTLKLFGNNFCFKALNKNDIFMNWSFYYNIICFRGKIEILH